MNYQLMMHACLSEKSLIVCESANIGSSELGTVHIAYHFQAWNEQFCVFSTPDYAVTVIYAG